MKIAVIRFSALGDLAGLSPILKSLKYKPTLITTNIGKAYYSDEYENIICLKSKSIISVLKLILKIRKEKFDVVIDFQCNDRSRLITKFLNAKIYNNLGIDVYNNNTFDIFKLILKDTNLLNEVKFEFIKKDKKYIVFNCGSSAKWISKRLPIGKWKEFANYLCKRFNLPIYLVGDKSEYEYLENISKKLNTDVKNLAGKTSLIELKNILKNAYLTISTDSAAMHISAVLGTPTIGIFGATNWLRSAPSSPWSTIIYDKTFFKDSKPLKTNTLEVNDKMYENIDLEDGIKEIEKYL